VTNETDIRSKHRRKVLCQEMLSIHLGYAWHVRVDVPSRD
jgi:hypothetical protein